MIFAELAPRSTVKHHHISLRRRNSKKAQRQQQWKIIVNYKVIFLFLSFCIFVNSFVLITLYTNLLQKAVKRGDRLRMKYLCGE